MHKRKRISFLKSIQKNLCVLQAVEKTESTGESTKTFDKLAVIYLQVTRSITRWGRACHMILGYCFPMLSIIFTIGKLISRRLWDTKDTVEAKTRAGIGSVTDALESWRNWGGLSIALCIQDYVYIILGKTSNTQTFQIFWAGYFQKDLNDSECLTWLVSAPDRSIRTSGAAASNDTVKMEVEQHN